MRPYVVLRYGSAEVWTRGPSAAIADGPTLENLSSVVAYDVRVSDVVLGGNRRYKFAPIGPLGSHEARVLERGTPPQTSARTKIISRDIVDHVLKGQPPIMRWPVRVSCSVS